MEFAVITLFPQVFTSYCKTSIIGRAVKKKLIKIHFINLRDFAVKQTRNKKSSYKVVDGRPFGGGVGMVLRVDCATAAISAAKKILKKPAKTILLTTTGKLFNQKMAQKLAKFERLVIFCGHYEGVDERIINFVDFQISIGDYILTGGELPALILIDAITRLQPGVLPKVSSSQESFANYLLAAPVYTQPVNFENLKVPEVLLSGNLSEIEKWRKRAKIAKTKRLRPDLFEKYLNRP